MLNLLAAVVTCVIVVPTDQVGDHYSPAVVERHERGHCAGMTSEDLVPPARFRHIPNGVHVEVMRLPTDVATRVCRAMGGLRYGCSWFE